MARNPLQGTARYRVVTHTGPVVATVHEVGQAGFRVTLDGIAGLEAGARTFPRRQGRYFPRAAGSNRKAGHSAAIRSALTAAAELGTVRL